MGMRHTRQRDAQQDVQLDVQLDVPQATSNISVASGSSVRTGMHRHPRHGTCMAHCDNILWAALAQRPSLDVLRVQIDANEQACTCMQWQVDCAIACAEIATFRQERG